MTPEFSARELSIKSQHLDIVGVILHYTVLKLSRAYSDAITFILSHFSVGKLIAPSDPAPQDINLNSNLFVLWGTRLMDSMAGQLLTHGANVPAASLVQVNPAAIALPPPVS